MILIHADWPAYALEHGVDYSLERLGQFPAGTAFYSIDDIDQCLLLRVGPGVEHHDSFDENRFAHVALWHEDVLKLFDRDLVEGVAGITPREWAERQAEKLKGIVLRLADGKYQDVPLPTPDDYTDSEATIALISDQGMRITDNGMCAFQELMLQRQNQIPKVFADRIGLISAAGAYDAAVREACVMLESHLRDATGSSSHGRKLVDEFCGGLDGRAIGSHMKLIRTELRACFKFVRNEFMHNLHDLTLPQCNAMLVRIAMVYGYVSEFASKNRDPNDKGSGRSGS